MDDARNGIQVLTRAANILRLLRDHPSGLSQADIGERLGLARSTVSRILISLEAEGFVGALGPRGPYRLGPEMARMAGAARRDRLVELRPRLETLSRTLRETVDLSRLEGDRALFLDQVVADRRLRAVSSVGETFPLHSSANGKVLLASLSTPDRERILAGHLEAFTDSTITDPVLLRAELAEIARTGIAYDREEQSPGVCAVGTLVKVGHDFLAISVPIPASRFYGREMDIAAALRTFVEESDWGAPE